MELLPFDSQYNQTVIQLFKQVFSESEGEAEGQAVSQFVDQLIHTTPSEDLYGFIADSDSSNKQVLGGIFFSRMQLSTGIWGLFSRCSIR
jgi:hypothetical protein